jgi:hypothetical protein
MTEYTRMCRTMYEAVAAKTLRAARRACARVKAQTIHDS